MGNGLTDGEVRSVVDLACEAGEVALSYFGSDRMEARSKGPRDVVTAADTASEDTIRKGLRAIFPADGVVGEEGTSMAGGSGRCWYIDPVDGTLNFSRGISVWCVSLSLFVGPRPVFGVIRDPIRRETFVASNGEARCNDVTLTGPRRVAPGDALVHVTVDFGDASQREGLQDLIHIAPHVLRTRNLGSAALALAYVAAGRMDALLHRHAYPWDYGAGVALIEAAGGEVLDIGGGTYTVETQALVAAADDRLARDLRRMISTSR